MIFVSLVSLTVSSTLNTMYLQYHSLCFSFASSASPTFGSLAQGGSTPPTFGSVPQGGGGFGGFGATGGGGGGFGGASPGNLD